MHSTIINGIDIPEGLTIQVDVVSLHRDNSLWDSTDGDTDTFNPERYSLN